MKKNWKFVLVLLVIILALLFLWVNNQSGQENNLLQDESKSIYQSTNLNLNFEYLAKQHNLEEQKSFIYFYSKIDNELILAINKLQCDLSIYNELEKVVFKKQNFWKSVDGLTYITLHPQTGACLTFSISDKKNEKTLVDLVTSLTFEGDLALADYEFICNDGKSLIASFVSANTSTVTLKLSDERAFSLSQVVAASGARYANQDESVIFWNKGDEAFLEENGEITFTDCATVPQTVSTEIDNKINKIANPASTNCLAKGGTLEIQTKEDGSQYGLCYFDDARACEEWAMMRGECPVGGVKTTGYDNLAQKYCAWLGGKTTAEENSVCVFSDGSTCLNSDLYLDACQKGDWPNK